MVLVHCQSALLCISATFSRGAGIFSPPKSVKRAAVSTSDPLGSCHSLVAVWHDLRVALTVLPAAQLVKEAMKETGEPYDLVIRTHRNLDDVVYVRKQVYALDEAVLDAAEVSQPQPHPDTPPTCTFP